MIYIFLVGQKMDIGNRVRLIIGNPFGIEGVIKSYVLMTRPINLVSDPTGLDTAKREKCFQCISDNGVEFSGFENQLELIK